MTRQRCRLHIGMSISCHLFQAHDTKSKGWISTNDFRNSMRSNHVDVSESDFSELVNFYESQSAGKVFYNDFLRAFLSVTTVD